jgi:hypothetical protein
VSFCQAIAIQRRTSCAPPCSRHSTPKAAPRWAQLVTINQKLAVFAHAVLFDAPRLVDQALEDPAHGVGV